MAGLSEHTQCRTVSLATKYLDGTGETEPTKCDFCDTTIAKQKVPAGSPYLASTSCNHGFTCHCSRTACFNCWAINVSIAGFFGDTNNQHTKQAFMDDLKAKYPDQKQPLKDKLADRETLPDVNLNYSGFTPESWTWFGCSRKCTWCADPTSDPFSRLYTGPAVNISARLRVYDKTLA